MPTPRRRKQPSRKPSSTKDDNVHLHPSAGLSKDRKPDWFRDQFLAIATELEKARDQETKQRHLFERAYRVTIRAARLVLEAENAGCLRSQPELRGTLHWLWDVPIKGTAGTVRIDENGKWHCELVGEAPPDDGKPFPVKDCTGDKLARLWVFPICGVVQSLRPEFFNEGAGKYDWPTIMTDSQGRPLGTEGKPLGFRKEVPVDAETGDESVSYVRDGEFACVGDDYDAEDALWHQRSRACDWAAVCRALADIVMEASDDPATGSLPPASETRPAWKRLKVTRQHSGNDLAGLDGREYRLRSNVADFLGALQEACGRMVLAETLTQTCGTRADRIFRTLPDELKQIIDAPGKVGRGYRMK